VTPGLRRNAVTWAIREKDYSQRRACRLIGIDPKTWRYASCRPDDKAARARLRELAGERRRFGYRRLHILLDREGIVMNHKKLFRLYREEGLSVRKRGGRKRALGTHTLLPLDDCLYALQATIPHLTRSSLHRCLQRHGISRLPEIEGDKPKRSKFKRYPIGYFHIDLAEVQTAEGKLRLFVAIDRTSKFAFVELHREGGKMIAAQFLRNLIEAVPYTIHTVLTDNGIQFTNHARHQCAFNHIFDRVCDENGIEHRLTKVKHPWTNGQVERVNRTIKEATVKRFHYETHDQLRQHLDDFVAAYNFARRLKTLRGLTPYEFICQQWQQEPSRFTQNPHHQTPGPNTLCVSSLI